jgi:hypothetical protein
MENRGRITDPTPWLQALADLVPLMPGSERQLEMLAEAVLQCPPDAGGSTSPR